MAKSIYTLATSRRAAKSNAEWAKANPDGERFLIWAAMQAETKKKDDPFMVSVEVPGKHRGRY